MVLLSWDDDAGWKKLADDLTADLVQKIEAHEARKALAAQQSGQPTSPNPVNASVSPVGSSHAAASSNVFAK